MSLTVCSATFAMSTASTYSCSDDGVSDISHRGLPTSEVPYAHLMSTMLVKPSRMLLRPSEQQ